MKKPRKIYLATSWKNKYFSDLFLLLLTFPEFEVYNFRNPEKDNNGFSWNQIDPKWEHWDINDYKKALEHNEAMNGFKLDFDALNWCDTCVLLLPSGRSAHIEAGYIKGQNKDLFIHIPEYDMPDLMYKMANGISSTTFELLYNLNK